MNVLGLLSNLPPWRDIAQDSHVDLRNDGDLVVLTGSRAREMDAILVSKTPIDQMKSALDGLVKRSSGSWLDGAGEPTALGKVDESDRMFVFVGDKQLLYVTRPPRPKKGQQWSDAQQLDEDRHKVKKVAFFKPPNTDLPFAILVSIREPAKLSRFGVGAPTAFGHMEVQLVPSTVEKFVLRVDPLAASEANVRIELWDDNVKDATADLSTIQTNYGLVQAGGQLGLGILLPDATFSTNGRLIFAEARATKPLLESALRVAEKLAARHNTTCPVEHTAR